ncbi:hypothetical protein NDI56_13065 [Haloarcula sp. S1CR25-12]|uniref:DUF3806 domain-containing protein n=1 Tax=Haloarcula saliterrae TaxID=2950534 RepID=A0ABU2FEF6_9EURY|nr:hypothetical protein [Haloarcula sp. S1CR25-12]MDS0260328.1 hypothetical protein [Haloarcula sp. S1CR25-12]
MGLFDSIRRVVGGGESGTTSSADDESGAADSTGDGTQSGLVETRDLDAAALRERAAAVAGEVDQLDFSLDSLEQFDDAIDAGYDEELATSDAPATYATDAVRFGCYLGEVLIRVYDGEWTRDPDWGVTITGADGSTTVAVFDVAERSITTGSVFAAVADRAAVEVGLDGDPVESETAPTDSSAPGSDDAGSTDGADPTADTDEASAEDETTDDAVAEEPTDEASAEEPMEDTSTDEPAADETSTDDGTTGDWGPSDWGTSDDTQDPGEADREAVDPAAEEPEADPLIDEAEPDIASEPPVDGAEATDQPSTEPRPTDQPSEALFEDGSSEPAAPETGEPTQASATPAPSESLFDDGESTGTPPAAEADSPTGPPAGEPSEPDSTTFDEPRATYAAEADELVSFWTEYSLDYTPDSLQRLDALVSAEWDDDRFDAATFGSEDTFDDRVFTSVSTELGGYFGEVLVRELDAEWSDETATDAVVVEGADGPLAIPVFKVAGTSIRQQPVFARSYDSLLSDLESDV